MSDIKALEAQVDRLIAAGFSQVESNRQLSSHLAVIGAQVGRLCDDMRDFIQHSNSRHAENEGKIRESSGKIRVLETKCADLGTKYANVEQRLQAIEETERARRVAGAR